MTKEAQEWLEGQHEVCTSCEKSFWADTHNDRDEGWFCDECIIRAMCEQATRLMEFLEKDKSDG